MNDLQLNIDNYGLEENKAQQIKNLYLPMVKNLEEMEAEFNKVVKMEINEESIAEARALRLKISKVRTTANKARQDAKENYILINKVIQGAFNALELATKTKEEKLLAMEKHYDNLEAKRVEDLQEKRHEQLLKYTENPELIPTNLGLMEDEVWKNYLTGSKTNYDTRKEAEKKAEDDRKKEIEKQDVYRSRKDKIAPYTFLISINGLTPETTEDQFNALLKKGEEAKKADDKKKSDAIKEDEKRKKEAKEKEKLEFKRYEDRSKQLISEFKLKPSGHDYTGKGGLVVFSSEIKESKDDQWSARLKNIKSIIKTQKEAEKNRKTAEEAEAKLKAKEDKEKADKKAQEAQKQAELKKGDTDKLNDLINDLTALKSKYVFESKENKEKIEGFKNLVDKSVAYLKI